MKVSNRIVRIASLSLTLGLFSCTFPALPAATPEAGPTPTSEAGPSPTSEPEPTPTPGWLTYANQPYQFSIMHPPELQAPAANYAEPFGQIGDQIFFIIGELNPFDCQGDCPVIEESTATEIGGQQATKIAGYIGASGGNVPQQYLSYVFQKDNLYYSFTLYALSSTVTSGGPDIAPLQPEDILLFEQMLATLQFTN